MAPSCCNIRATSSAGASRTSSELGLKAAPRQQTLHPGPASPPAWSTDQVDGSRTTPVVDGVDLRQERHDFPTPSSSARWMKARMSLGRQPPPKPSPGWRKRPPIRRRGTGPSPAADVGAGRLAHLRHRVDVGDLGRQERVRRDLDQLGGREVGGDNGYAGLDDWGERGGELLFGPRPRRRRRRVGPAAGCPRRRSPRAGTRGSRRARRPDPPARCPARAGSADGGADRDGGLADDQATTAQVRREVAGHGLDIP